jgi:membrane-bound metal-dependent hydrolase YbcI (DUF457 family)
MPLPAAHFLVGAAAADAARGRQRISVRRAWVVGGAVAILPDMDIAVGVFVGQGSALHGTFTHTSLAVLCAWIVARTIWGRAWGRMVAAAYLSHLLIDLLEADSGTSVQIAWPLTEARLPSVLPIFPVVPWEKGRGALEAALSLLDPEVLPWLLAQTAVGLVPFLVISAVRRLAIRRATEDAGSAG